MAFPPPNMRSTGLKTKGRKRAKPKTQIGTAKTITRSSTTGNKGGATRGQDRAVQVKARNAARKSAAGAKKTVAAKKVSAAEKLKAKATAGATKKRGTKRSAY